MEKKLTPVSEILADLEIMVEEAKKGNDAKSKVLLIFSEGFQKHILDSNFLETEQKEIERACKAGLSGTPISSSSYYNKRFFNKNDV